MLKAMTMTVTELPCEVLHTGVTKGKDRYTKVKMQAGET